MNAPNAGLRRTLLLNPGPVTLSERVRQALLREDLCHRELDYRALQRDVQQRLSRVYPHAEESYLPILLTGSGTAAVEAMLGSLVPSDGRVLVLANGVYGERMATMLARQGKAHEVLPAPWTATIDLAAVERRLENGGVSHVAAIHHETTTGRLNPIAALGALCRRYQVALLLDAVSSFGAEEIDFEEWGIEACAATANKCLHGIPGTAFVMVHKDALKRPSGAVSLYLDLHAYAKGWESGEPPFTPAVHSLYALQEALREFAEAGGQVQRRARYRLLAQTVMQGLQRMGIRPFLDQEADYSCVLASYHLPAGIGYETLHDRLKDAGFVIYAGQGSFNGSMFRISTMGDLTDSDIERLLGEIRTVCRINEPAASRA
jgi:2-aminoethylphosphonate-pyruvate transaminase